MEEMRAALEAAVYYLMPDISRGPAHKNWIKVMKQVAAALKWETCHACGGSGQTYDPNRFHKHDICVPCLGTGYQQPE